MKFSREEVSARIRRDLNVTAKGCWTAPSQPSPIGLTDKVTGARFSRSIRQWAFYAAWGMDPYKKGVTQPSVCGTKLCYNPDHQSKYLYCASAEPAQRKTENKALPLTSDGAVKWWNGRPANGSVSWH